MLRKSLHLRKDRADRVVPMSLIDDVAKNGTTVDTRDGAVRKTNGEITVVIDPIDEVVITAYWNGPSSGDARNREYIRVLVHRVVSDHESIDDLQDAGAIDSEHVEIVRQEAEPAIETDVLSKVIRWIGRRG